MTRVRLSPSALLFALCSWSPPVWAQVAPPVLYFSDMPDGPTAGWEGSDSRGAAVTIWGNNLGALRGSSVVTACGVALDQAGDYAEWAATTRPQTARGLERITFWLRPPMQAGASTITVTTAYGTSNAIPFQCRDRGSSRIYFLSPSGLDTNNGLFAGQGAGQDGPHRSPTWVRSILHPGDAAYFREGIYDEVDDYGGMLRPAVLLFYIGSHNNGAAGNSITVKSYPGELAQLGRAIGLAEAGTRAAVSHTGSRGTLLAHWTFSNFAMEAYQAVFDQGFGAEHGSEGLRLVGNEATTSYAPNAGTGAGGIFYLSGGGAGTLDAYILGNYLHDPCVDVRGGPTRDGARVYQLYIGGYGVLDGVHIAYNEMGWNQTGRAMQLYGHQCGDSIDNVHIHHNYFHDTFRQGIVVGGGEGCATPYEFVKNAYIYDNIITRTGPTDVALQMNDHGGRFFVYNNLLVQSDSFRVITVTRPALALFENNIIIGNRNALDYYDYFGDMGGNLCLDCTGPDSCPCKGRGNLYFGRDPGDIPAWDTSTLDDVDPRFVSTTFESIFDYQLRADSPAVDAGVADGDLGTRVITDFLGAGRPQNGAFDIGPFEFMPRCSIDADCASPPPCRSAAGATCIQGACSYPPAPCPDGAAGGDGDATSSGGDADAPGGAAATGCDCRGSGAAPWSLLLGGAAFLRARRRFSRLPLSN